MSKPNFNSNERNPSLTNWTDSEIGVEIAILLKEMAVRTGHGGFFIIIENVNGDPAQGYTQFAAQMRGLTHGQARETIQQMTKTAEDVKVHSDTSSIFANNTKH